MSITLDAFSVSITSPAGKSAFHLSIIDGKIVVIAISFLAAEFLAARYVARKGRMSARSSAVKIDLRELGVAIWKEFLMEGCFVTYI